MNPEEMAHFIQNYTTGDELRDRAGFLALREVSERLLREYFQNPALDPTELAGVLWLTNCIACKFDISHGHPIVDDAPTCRVATIDHAYRRFAASVHTADDPQQLLERVHRNLSDEYSVHTAVTEVFDRLLDQSLAEL
jgi:hypothetical protein